MEKTNINFEDRLRLLQEKADSVTGILNRCSQKIKSVEAVLDSSRSRFPFRSKFLVETCDKGIKSTIWYFSWENYETRSRTWRIFIVCEEKILPEKEYICALKKPFGDTSSDIRMKFVPYLDNFMDEYTEHLAGIIKSLEEPLRDQNI